MTVAVPTAAGVKLVDGPDVVDSDPVVVDQVTIGETRLPNESTPLAVSVCDAPSAMLALGGASVSGASAPAVTVSDCAPDWRPSADAVSVGEPAVVSR